MGTHKPAIAAAQLVLIFPAALFLTALLARQLQPLQYEPAHTAQQIVMWYAGRVWTLWVLLISLPLAVLLIGCFTFLRNRIDGTQPAAAVRLHPATLIIAAATLAAGAILAVVAVHVLMN